jgi:TonB family protein
VLSEIEYIPGFASAPEVVEPVAVDAPPSPAPSEQPQRFRRAEAVADVAPEPQSDFALADRLSSRLEALREQRAAVVAAAPAPVAARWSAAAVPDPTPGPTRSNPMELNRGTPARAPMSLERGAPVGSTRLDPATVAMPARAAAAETPASASTASRNLAGARLSGPVADRPIKTHMTPLYPEWAKRDGVEGSVTLRFYVRPDGSIKENVLVEKTAGFEDFDQSALVALLQWKFQALPAGRSGEQWGTITFHFRLRDAG